jgi:glycine betaine/choline ABC-type transport system substrate-binding protein
LGAKPSIRIGSAGFYEARLMGEICAQVLVLLQDDKQSQPSDNIAPPVRSDYVAKVDGAAFRKLLDDVSAKMTTDQLTKLSVAINVDQEDIAGRRKAVA